MLRLFAPIALFLLLVGGVVLSDRPQPRADFVFVNRGDVSTLDLAQMSWQQDFRAARLLFEGLTRQDVFSPGYDAVPGVAESWEVSPDRRRYTFRIRSDARWSNGEPVTADDFRRTFFRGLLPDTGADYLKLYQFVRGGAGFTQRRLDRLEAFNATAHADEAARRRAAMELWAATWSDFDANVAVLASDPRTLTFELERATPFFLDLAAFPSFFPVYGPALDRHESIDPETALLTTDPRWTKPDRLVTNGPFTLESWRFKREMRFRRSETYWDRRAIAIETIACPSIGDPSAQVLAFRTGAVDWVTDATPGYLPQMLREKAEFLGEHSELSASLESSGLDALEVARQLPPDPRNRIHTFPAFGTYFYNFNCLPNFPDGRPNPFADPRVRRAFAMAIDRSSIAENVRRTGEPPASTLIPIGSIAGYSSPRGLQFDPERARFLLVEAGYPGGAGLPMIEILFNSEGGHDLIAQAVARTWTELLGVTVRLEKKEIKVFREQVKSGNFMVSRASWFGDYGDPTTFLNINRTGDGNNDRRYSSPAFDGLLDRALDETDALRRFELLTEAERYLLEEDAPIAPIFRWHQIYLYDPHRFTGLSPHPRQIQNLFLIDRLGDGVGPDVPKVMRSRDPRPH